MLTHNVFHCSLFKPGGTPTFKLPEPEEVRLSIQDQHMAQMPHSIIAVQSPERSPRRRWYIGQILVMKMIHGSLQNVSKVTSNYCQHFIKERDDVFPSRKTWKIVSLPTYNPSDLT